MENISGPEDVSPVLPRTRSMIENFLQMGTRLGLDQPAFDDVYSEEVFNNLKMELEVLEDQGKDLGKQLRKVAEETKRVRDQLEEQCHEVWGHTFEDGICTNCTKVEEPDEDAWNDIKSRYEREGE